MVRVKSLVGILCVTGLFFTSIGPLQYPEHTVPNRLCQTKTFPILSRKLKTFLFVFEIQAVIGVEDRRDDFSYLVQKYMAITHYCLAATFVPVLLRFRF